MIGSPELTLVLSRDREWETIEEGDRIAFVIRERLGQARYYLKETDPPAEFYRGEEIDGGFVFHGPPDVSIDDRLTLYTTLKRHIELDFVLVRTLEPGSHVLRPSAARIAKRERAYPRFNNVNGSMHAANFQVSKSDISIDPTRPQVANKVIFNEFEKRLAGEIPGLKIHEFASKERPPETVFLNKRTDAIFVADVAELETYRASAPGTVDYYALLEDEEEGLADRKRRQYIERHIQSLIACPILYETNEGRMAPIAFFYLESRRGMTPLSPALLDRLRAISEEIIDRIEDASLITVKDKQTVLNISEGGVALELTHPDLLKYVPHRRTITFDLVFRMQAPLRFRGSICHMHKSGVDSLIVGINLEGSGHSDFRKSARERLTSLIRMLKG